MRQPTAIQPSKLVRTKGQKPPPPQDRIDAMAESIQSCGGIIQPIMVRAAGDKYEIVKGEVRWLAAIKLKLDIVPIKVVDFDDHSAHARAAVGLLASEAREDLSPTDVVAGLESLYTQFGANAREIVRENRPSLEEAVAAAPELKSRVNAVLSGCGIEPLD